MFLLLSTSVQLEVQFVLFINKYPSPVLQDKHEIFEHLKQFSKKFKLQSLQERLTESW